MSNRFFKPRPGREGPGAPGSRGRVDLRGLILLALAAGLLITGLWIYAWQGRDPGTQTTTEPFRNALAGSISLYLRDAAVQPVHWMSWGSEAFARAEREDKPILLDIGGIGCRACRLMALESYQNKEIAALINEHFVAIKVDRDERPDIDRRYQQVVTVLSNQGGWPLTVFLTPQGDPFFGGTYFLPQDRGERTGLKTILPRLAEAYRAEKEEVRSTARQIATLVEHVTLDSTRPGAVSPDLVDAIWTNTMSQFDPINGGFGRDIKPPAARPVELALLRHFESGDPEILEMATRTLDGMAHGGVYDQIGEGFFRSSTDPRWRVPRFEKTLDGNADLLIIYLHAYQATGKELYRQVAEGIIRYINGRLSDQASGGFYAQQEGDTIREDYGDYYTWTVREVRKALSRKQAEVIMRYYDIRPRGEMSENPDRNVPYIATSPEAIAQELKMPEEEIRRLIEEGRSRLLEARSVRKLPRVDPSLYTDRNAMMISAYLEAHSVLGDPQPKDFALRTLDRLMSEAYREGKGMNHAFGNESPHLAGLLNDQVWTVNALLDTFEVTADQRYLRMARDLLDYALDQFWDPQGGGFIDRRPAAEDPTLLKLAIKEIRDDPSAASNAVAALALNRMANLTNDAEFERKTMETLKAFGGFARGYDHSAATYALAVYYSIRPPAQAVIIGAREDPRTQVLWKSALNTYRPGKLVAAYDPADINPEALPPAVSGALRAFGASREPRAYICASFTCAPPTGDPEEVIDLMKRYGVDRLMF